MKSLENPLEMGFTVTVGPKPSGWRKVAPTEVFSVASIKEQLSGFLDLPKDDMKFIIDTLKLLKPGMEANDVVFKKFNFLNKVFEKQYQVLLVLINHGDDPAVVSMVNSICQVKGYVHENSLSDQSSSARLIGLLRHVGFANPITSMIGTAVKDTAPEVLELTSQMMVGDRQENLSVALKTAAPTEEPLTSPPVTTPAPTEPAPVVTPTPTASPAEVPVTEGPTAPHVLDKSPRRDKSSGEDRKDQQKEFLETQQGQPEQIEQPDDIADITEETSRSMPSLGLLPGAVKSTKEIVEGMAEYRRPVVIDMIGKNIINSIGTREKVSAMTSRELKLISKLDSDPAKVLHEYDIYINSIKNKRDAAKRKIILRPWVSEAERLKHLDDIPQRLKDKLNPGAIDDMKRMKVLEGMILNRNLKDKEGLGFAELRRLVLKKGATLHIDIGSTKITITDVDAGISLTFPNFVEKVTSVGGGSRAENITKPGALFGQSTKLLSRQTSVVKPINNGFVGDGVKETEDHSLGIQRMIYQILTLCTNVSELGGDLDFVLTVQSDKRDQKAKEDVSVYKNVADILANVSGIARDQLDKNKAIVIPEASLDQMILNTGDSPEGIGIFRVGGGNGMLFVSNEREGCKFPAIEFPSFDNTGMDLFIDAVIRDLKTGEFSNAEIRRIDVEEAVARIGAPLSLTADMFDDDFDDKVKTEECKNHMDELIRFIETHRDLKVDQQGVKDLQILIPAIIPGATSEKYIKLSLKRIISRLIGVDELSKPIARKFAELCGNVGAVPAILLTGGGAMHPSLASIVKRVLRGRKGLGNRYPDVIHLGSSSRNHAMGAGVRQLKERFSTLSEAEQDIVSVYTHSSRITAGSGQGRKALGVFV